MLFQMPNGVPLRSVPGGVSEEWRCAGCGTHLRGTELDLPSFCVFCKAWSQWRRDGDEAWARALGGWEDDGGWSSQHLAAGALR
jgi:hypothetical protein